MLEGSLCSWLWLLCFAFSCSCCSNYQCTSSETWAVLCPNAHPACEPLGDSEILVGAQGPSLWSSWHRHCTSGLQIAVGLHPLSVPTSSLGSLVPPEACFLLTGWPETLSGPAAQHTSLPFKRLQPNLQWGEPFQVVLLRGRFLNPRTHSFIFFASLQLFSYIHWIILSIKLPVWGLLCGFCLLIGPTLIMWGREIMLGSPRC